MGLLVDFHMSDNWADPGKQCVPVAWQSYHRRSPTSRPRCTTTPRTRSPQLDRGRRAPRHGPDRQRDHAGHVAAHVRHRRPADRLPTKVHGRRQHRRLAEPGHAAQGRHRGRQGSRPGNPDLVPHRSRRRLRSTSKNWIDNAIKQGAILDTFGESCYQQYQGDPSIRSQPRAGWHVDVHRSWCTPIPTCVSSPPNTARWSAQINDVVFDLPGNKGMGTFDWEPTTSGPGTPPSPRIRWEPRRTRCSAATATRTRRWRTFRSTRR